jgi:hypothetical protein
MTLYIPDASAIIALEDACTASSRGVEDVLESLTDLAIAGDLVCPPLVLKECKRLGDGEPTTRWLKSTSGHFGPSDDPWEYMETVLASCPGLLDPDDIGENPQVAVLALALFMQRSRNDEVFVVTDQWVDNPIRQSMGSAAALVQISTLTVDQFVEIVTA